MIFFDVHTHKKALLKNVFSIENKYSDALDFTTPFSIGIHPWFINEDKIKEALLSVEEKLQQEKCVAFEQEQCFAFEQKEVPCPSNPLEISKIPVQG